MIFLLKGILLTCVFTNAIQRWGIFDPIRARLKARSTYLQRLLECYECSSVWGALVAILYLTLLDYWPLTTLLIIHWAAWILRILIDYLDAARAAKEGEI